MIPEMLDFMNGFKEGHIVIKVTEDDEAFRYNVDIVVHGYIFDGDDLIDTDSRSFGVIEADDKMEAEKLAKRVRSELRKIAFAGFEVNDEIEYM